MGFVVMPLHAADDGSVSAVGHGAALRIPHSELRIEAQR